ncbi:hypothetical protein ABE583_02735 [Stenotrophomonas sp. TWI143]|uniref:hypothetical protein n=1 Tax=Stenotrophomonas sp. TWI143 TaxID=3136771 RepID=UPI0032089136
MADKTLSSYPSISADDIDENTRIAVVTGSVGRNRQLPGPQLGKFVDRKGYTNPMARAGVGYPQAPVDYAGGIFVDSTELTVVFNERLFQPVAAALPFVTTEAFNPSLWNVVQGVSTSLLKANDGAALIGFIQDGPGAVLRTLERKSREQTSPEDFGAIGDGQPHFLSERFSTLQEAQEAYPFVTSLTQSIDWAAITAAVLTGRQVLGSPTANYMLSQSVEMIDASCLFDGRQCQITAMSGSFPTFSVIANYGAQVAVNAIEMAVVDYTEGQGGGATPTHSLVVSTTTGFSVGDIIKVMSDDFIPGSRAADLERIGEHTAVGGIDANRINLYSYLFEKYVSNIRVARMNSDVLVDIRNFRSDYVEPGNAAIVYVQGCLAPDVSGIRAMRAKSETVEFVSCLFDRTHNIVTSNGTTDFTTGAYAYGVVEYGCEFGMHSDLFGYQIRHVYTDGSLITQPNDERTYRYGRTKGSAVVNSKGWLCQNAAFDTHWSSHGIQFMGCHGYAPFNGPNSSQRNFQLRGSFGLVQDCVSYGGTGVNVFQGVAHPEACQGNRIENLSHFFLKESQGRAAIQITGQSANEDTIPTVYVDGLVTNQDNSGTYPHVVATRGIARVSRPTMVTKQGGANVACAFLADEGGQIYVDGGSVDARGASGTGLRLCKMGPGSRIELSNLQVQGQFTHLLDGQQNNDIMFDCRDVRLDRALAQGPGYTNSLSSNIRVDYTVGFRRTSRAVFAQTYAQAGDKVLSLERRGGRTLHFSATVSAGTGVTRISTIDAGAMDGQELVIRNSSSSVALLRVAANAAIAISADRDLAPGALLRLIYSDAAAAWLPA